MSHGFGNIAMIAMLESLKGVIDEGLRYLGTFSSNHMYHPYNNR